MRKELIESKGLTKEMTDDLEKFVKLKGSPREMMDYLTTNQIFGDDPIGNNTLKEMRILFDYLDGMGGIEFNIYSNGYCSVFFT